MSTSSQSTSQNTSQSTPQFPQNATVDAIAARAAELNLLPAAETPLANGESASKAIDELCEKAKGKFSREEIDAFIEMGKRVASKAIIDYFASCVKQSMVPDHRLGAEVAKTRGNKLLKKISKTYPYKSAMVLSMELPNKWTLRAGLSMVPNDYKPNFMIREGDIDVKMFVDMINQLRYVASTYYVEYCTTYKPLFEQIIDFCYTIDFSEFDVDAENNMTLCSCDTTTSRVGIVVFYCDEKGSPMHNPNDVMNRYPSGSQTAQTAQAPQAPQRASRTQNTTLPSMKDLK